MALQSYKHGILLPVAYENKIWIDNVRNLTQNKEVDFINYWTNNYEFCSIRKGMKVYFVCEACIVGEGVVIRSSKGNSIKTCFNDYGVKNGLTPMMSEADFVDMINNAFSTSKKLSRLDPIGCILLEDVIIYDESDWKICTNIHGTYF